MDEFAKKVFRFFVASQRKSGIQPTVREIMAGINNRSFKQVTDALLSLEQAGLMERIERKHRNWRLTDEGTRTAEKMTNIIMREVRRYRIAQVRAGALAQEWETLLRGDLDGAGFDDDDPSGVEINVQDLPLNPDDLFPLRVIGDSMIDALIQEGDIVLIQRWTSLDALRDGLMVVAENVVEGSVTLKYYRDAGDFVELVPANPNYPLQRIPKRDAAILGVVSAVIRR